MRQCLPHAGTYFRASCRRLVAAAVRREYFHLKVLEKPAFEA